MRIVHVDYWKDGQYGVWSDMSVGITENGEYRTKVPPDMGVYSSLDAAIQFGEGLDTPECPVIVEVSDVCHVLAFGISLADIKE